MPTRKPDCSSRSGFLRFWLRAAICVSPRGQAEMSDWAIMAVGAFVTMLLSGGVIFTYREFHRLNQEAADRHRPADN